jgi:hypothetical protein
LIVLVLAVFPFSVAIQTMAINAVKTCKSKVFHLRAVKVIAFLLAAAYHA